MKLAATLLVTLLPVLAHGQEQSPDVKALFEAGKYAETVAAVSASPDASPEEVYLAGHASWKLEQLDQARATFARLGSDPDNPWTYIGQSASALVAGQTDAALEGARRAVEMASGLARAHYQLGYAYAFVQDYAKAAPAFDKSAEIDPGYAYSHYYAGLSFYQIKRIDKMAQHFEAFLKLAPSAPERSQVESIMRTVRGR